jgi:hypothetical protein
MFVSSMAFPGGGTTLRPRRSRAYSFAYEKTDMKHLLPALENRTYSGYQGD